MHIKQVIIRGFKTYKEQTSLDEDFSPGTNVVVGFNGSGKSNFFQAILFVLSDQYTSLRPETRKALLHEGAGQAVLTAYVEVILDNSDRRIPIDCDQVAIRRLIGVKKDDWLLDGKHSTKAEIFGLLEGAGFAKTSPYYIVQQGKVGELTLMSDGQRLGLLKDISGAGIYDVRRAESVKIMEDTATRRTRTKELIGEIHEKLKALEDEQRELRECENLEAKKRTLEYVLADREWRAAQDRIEELNVRRVEASAKLVGTQKNIGAIRSQASEAEAELARQEDDRRKASDMLTKSESARDRSFEALSNARLEVDNESRRQREAEDDNLARLGGIAEARTELEKSLEEIGALRPKVSELEIQFREIDQKRQVVGAAREHLLAKQSRKQQFASVEERNKSLNEEIAKGNSRIHEAREKLKACEEKVGKYKERVAAAVSGAQSKRKSLEAVERQLSDAGKDMRKFGEKLDGESEKSRLLHQQRSKLLREIEDSRQAAHTSQGKLEATMPRSYRQAIVAVSRWAQERELQDRLRGTLLSHIEVPADFRVAVESFAGMALFNMLAVDDDVAADAVKFVRTKRLGAIVVTPLSQIRNKEIEYPQIEGVKPLMEVIRCADWVRPAVQQVFGRGVICRSMELCEQVAKSHGVDAITLDGDRISRRGVVTGGYRDPARCIRIPLADAARAAGRKLRAAERQLPGIEAEIAKTVDNLDSLHMERRSRQEKRDVIRAKMQAHVEEAQNLEESSAKDGRSLNELGEWQHRMEMLIQQCNVSVSAKMKERSSKTLSGLTAAEEAEFERLTAEAANLAASYNATKTELAHVQDALGEREARLENCSRKRLYALEMEAVSGIGQEAPEKAEEYSHACGRLEREHREASDAAAAAVRALAETSEGMESARRRVEELAGEEQKLQELAAEGALRVERLEAEAVVQAQRRAEVDGRLSGLAAPAGEVERGRQLPKPQLVRELAETGKQLQVFQHVNRKAVEQYENFAEQLRDLETRIADIESGEVSIQDALTQIDAQKEATLLQTLRRMDEQFQSVFTEMVPGGRGRLMVVRHEKQEDTPSPGKKGKGPEENALIGIKIEASFTGQAESFLVMNQLSGGQKTIVALSMIFAIQRLEPAPFYLLDEVDANLDASYRSALANLIARTAAGGSQVIMTTFRLEALDKADRCYRVYQQNRASRIDAVTRDQAQQVLREQDRLAEAEAAAAAEASGNVLADSSRPVGAITAH